MKNKRIGFNAILNVIKSGLSIVFPLITFPYALRMVGVTNIGSISYVNSIVSYFSLFAMLGVTSYGIREGAKVREKKESFDEFANEIFTINVITTIISYSALLLMVLCVPEFRQYWKLFSILGLSVILSTIGVDWINTVYEDYLFITIRGIVIQLISLILLFTFVKGPDDYLIYASLQILSTGFIAISNWIHCRKYTKLRIVLRPHFRKHFPRLLLLFANSLAISIYVNFDTTMLGWIKGDFDVGIYSASVRVYGAVKSIMMAVYAVTIPRLSAYFGQNNMVSFRDLYSKLWSYMALILIPAGIGLACVSKEIIWIFGGSEYIRGTVSLQILSSALVFSIFGGLVTTCLNITIKREKENLIATILSAVLNCVLNLFFIPLFSFNGAAFTTLLAELFVLIFCYTRIPDKNIYLDKNMVSKNIIHAIVASLPIVLITFVVKTFSSIILLSLVVIVTGSILMYISVLMILKNDIAIGIVDTVKRKILKI